MKTCEVPILVKMPLELAEKINLHAATMKQRKPGASPNRSEAIRDLLRRGLKEKEENEGGEGN